MTRNSAQDKAAFEDVLSDAFGKDMTGWTRYSKYEDRDPDEVGQTTRLVIDVDASGKPLPPPGTRPAGYTLGGVVIISISEAEYFGRPTPLVQINAWNPVNRRLMDTGHSMPSALEIGSMTFGDPEWQSKPELVERVLSEVETDLRDAMADAINQLTGGSAFPSAFVERVDPWEDSRGFPDELGIVVPSVPNPDVDIPADIHEATPWVPDDVHEVTPWVPDDVHETTPWEEEGAAPEGDAPSPVDGTSADEDLSPADWEAYPGQNEDLEALENAGPPTESGPLFGGDETVSSGGGGMGMGIKVAIGAGVAAIVIVVAAVMALSGGGSDEVAAATTSVSPTVGDAVDTPAESTTSSLAPTVGDDAPQLDADEVPEDELFDIPIPERTPASLDAPTSDGPTAQEMLLLPAPEGTDTDDAQRPAGGALYVDTVYVVDWQDDIIVSNGRITPGGLFPPGSGWNGEYLILADCSGDACVYSTPLANGDTLTFTERGRTIYGSAIDTSGGCERDIFISFKVSDFQTINGRLVPDAIRGARIETGACESDVYREITYEGGFRFVGSYNDQ